MRITIVALVVVGALGCSSDPCSGVSGTCISGRVEGAVRGLDQLRVVLDGAPQAQVSPTAPSAFELPVKLAIALPASATSPATITVDGLAGGQQVATSGAQVVSFTPGAHASYTFNLAAGGGGDDLSVEPTDLGTDMGPDMGPVIVPGHVTVYPTTLSFPATARGAQSAPQTVTLYNRTGQAISTTPLDMAGVGAVLEFYPKSISPATCTLGPSGIGIPANVDCQLQMVFAPFTSGARSAMTNLIFSNGDSATLSSSGQATPAWTAEGPGGGAVMRAVWATTGAAYAVGGVISGGSWLATPSMPGTWNFQQGGANPWRSVVGLDTSHVWAGADGGIYGLQSGNTWAPQTMTPNDAGFPGDINGVWAAGSMEAYAVSTAGQIYRFNGTSWGLISQASQPLYAVSGANSGNFVVVGGAGFLATPLAGVLSQVITNANTALRGVWEPSTSNIFAVGDAVGAGPGTIVHCTGSPLSCALETSPVAGNLAAIAGRLDSTTMQLDIYAVGALGAQVLHSTGNGTWTAVAVPMNEANNGVFVMPTGEAFVVGSNGDVEHLY